MLTALPTLSGKHQIKQMGRVPYPKASVLGRKEKGLISKAGPLRAPELVSGLPLADLEWEILGQA